MNNDATQEILRRIEDLRIDLKEDLSEVKDDMREVKAEVKKTNGRVTALEMWRHGLEQIKATRSWRFPALVGLITGLTVTVVGGVVITAITLLTN